MPRQTETRTADPGDRLVLAVPQTSFAGAALPVHEAVLADLGLGAEPVTVPDGDPLDVLRLQAEALRDRVAGSGEAVVVAAECTLAGAIVAGLRRREPDANLIWLDAHADLNTQQSSPSGLLVGMALAAALGRCLPELLGDTPPGRVVLHGARTFDPPEREALDAWGLVEADSAAVALDRLPPGPVHVHLDGDVFDPSDEPNAPYPVAGGPSAAAVGRFVAELAERRRIVGVSVCGYAATDGSVSAAYRTALGPVLGG